MSERGARVAVAAVFFSYVLYIRVYDIADTFLMLGEQTRDWAIALGGITELPLTGAPSTAGGRGFGPVYYWILWLGRNLVGPFTDFLPHAGGLTVALLQSTADAWLLLALWRRGGLFLALAMWLGISSAPFFVAAPLMVGLVAANLQVRREARVFEHDVVDTSTRRDRFQRAAITGGLIAMVILVLQIPYFIQIARDPAAPMGPTSAISNMANAPAFRIDRSYNSVVNGTGEL